MKNETKETNGQARDVLAPMDLDLTRREVPVTLKDKDGSPTEYLLVELDGAGRDAYLNNLGKRLKPDASGKNPSVRDFTGLQANLLTRCMLVADGRTPVTEKDIQAWPSRVQNALYKRAKEISALQDDADDKEGED